MTENHFKSLKDKEDTRAHECACVCVCVCVFVHTVKTVKFFSTIQSISTHDLKPGEWTLWEAFAQPVQESSVCEIAGTYGNHFPYTTHDWDKSHLGKGFHSLQELELFRGKAWPYNSTA